MSALVAADLVTWLEDLAVDLSQDSGAAVDNTKLTAACDYADGVLAGYQTSGFPAATLKPHAYALAAIWLLAGRLIPSSPTLDGLIDLTKDWLKGLPPLQTPEPVPESTAGFWSSETSVFSGGGLG